MPKTAQKTPPPEVAAAKAQLDQLPDGWLPPEFVDQILARAYAQHVANLVDQRLAAARSEVATALGTGNIDQALVSEARASALANLRPQIPGLNLDPRLPRQCLGDAGSILVAAVRQLDVTQLDYEAEQRQWRSYLQSTGKILDPPQATDADRAAIPVRAAAVKTVEGIKNTLTAWTRDLNSTADPLQLLLSAAGQIKAAEPVAKIVAEANQVIAEANRARRSAGLNWSYDRALAAERTQMAGV